MDARSRKAYGMLAKLSAEDKSEVDEIERKAIANFQGDLTELESALGMLRLGHHFGWKVLHLLHSKATVRKYEAILGIKVLELFPEAGPSAERSNGFRLAQAISNFWKIVNGDKNTPKIPDRRLVKLP